MVIPIEYLYEHYAREAIKTLFSYFAKSYVETNINEWQQKGEFERADEWQQRVNETIRNEKAKELVKEAEKEFIADRIKNSINKMELGAYDIDNETFLVKSNLFGNLLIPVPHSEAQDFKAN